MSKELQTHKEQEPVLRVEEVRCYYPQKKKHVRPDGSVTRKAVVKAVDGVSFSIPQGAVIGVIGESGCGKSTLGRLLVRLEKCTAGRIYLDGTDMETLYRKDRLAFRRQTQMVFQNPFDTFDPRHSIGKILMDTMKLHRIRSSEAERRELAIRDLASAGLLPAESFLDRFPYELSGGQLQRISILRSMLLGPKVMVADEPVSMLDVSIRADIINLLYETTRRENTAMVFISYLDGTDMETLYRKDRLAFRRQTQMVFQNPFDTFDPRHSIGKILMDTMKLHRIRSSEAERRELAIRDLASAGLLPAESFLDRFPYELSGGQLQRISILRSMLLGPKVMVADEPVSMLDVSIRADIINLLYETTRRENTAMVFISHDITTTRYISDRIAVMYLGRIVELGQADEVVTNPQHPYTRALISNCGSMDPREKRQTIHLPGEPPTPVDIPSGCPFWPRCPQAAAACREQEQTLRDTGANHLVRCSQITGL